MKLKQIKMKRKGRSAAEASKLVFACVASGDRLKIALHPMPRHLLVVIIVAAMESRIRTA